MHGTRASVAELIKGLPVGVADRRRGRGHTRLVCISVRCWHGLDGKSIAVGAQNCAVEPMLGALTGEIAPSQLADAELHYGAGRSFGASTDSG